jgi:hypothetical protein
MGSPDFFEKKNTQATCCLSRQTTCRLHAYNPVIEWWLKNQGSGFFVQKTQF